MGIPGVGSGEAGKVKKVDTGGETARKNLRKDDSPESRDPGGSVRSSQRVAHGEVMRAKVEKGAKSAYDVVDKASTLNEKAALLKIEKLQSDMVGLEKDLKKAARDYVKTGSPQAKTRLAGVLERKNRLAQGIQDAEARAGRIDGVNKKLGPLKQGVGKIAVGLDIVGKLGEFQKQDPQNWEKNIVKATLSSLSGLPDLKLSNKASAAEAATALVKLGLEAAGLKDTELYKAADLASQAFPGDAIAKGVEQAVEQVYATWETATTGKTERWMDLNDRNLNGKNGAVMQGAAVLGDLVFNGGKAVPTSGDGVYFKDFFDKLLKPDAKPEIPYGQTGRTVDEKVSLLRRNQGADTPAEDVLKMQRILTDADGPELAATLEKMDTKELVASLHPYENKATGRTHDPLAAAIRDVVREARAAKDEGVRERLTDEARHLIMEAGRQNRRDSLEPFKKELDAGGFADMPGSFRQAVDTGYLISN